MAVAKAGDQRGAGRPDKLEPRSLMHHPLYPPRLDGAPLGPWRILTHAWHTDRDLFGSELRACEVAGSAT